MTIDSKLKLYIHINDLTNTVRKFFYIFHYVRFIFNVNLKLLLFLSLFQSIASHGICTWGQAYDAHTYRPKITINRLVKSLFLETCVLLQ